VTLSWEDTSPIELGFEIERRGDHEGEFQRIGTVGADVTTYKDTGLTPGNTYFYRIRSFNSSGYSYYTDEMKITIDAN
jgi:hypothetical protein